MEKYDFLERDQEVDRQFILRDTRPTSVKFGAWLAQPANFAKGMFFLAAASVLFSALAVPLLLLTLLTVLWYSWQIKLAPIRYPVDIGGMDPSMPDPETGRPTAAAGILYLGNERSSRAYFRNREIWVANTDARTHMLGMGTTGSGKTEFLLSIAFNALAWGSGFFYSDGKADNSLFVKTYSLCRKMGRTEDLLVINYMTGGADPFRQKRSSARRSNGMNPFYGAGADFVMQLLSSLLPKVDGEGAQWQQKAIGMMDATVRALTYLAAKGEMEVSIATIREYIDLTKIIELYLRDDLPEAAHLPIKAYLETGLPGFDKKKAIAGKAQDQTVLDQHGYRTGQFARTLAMMMDTYGYIFKERMSEVDMMDVMLNRRILVVMIPTMEKSAQESANLGKLVVASMRLMMAMNLGDKLEGYYKDVIEAKATNAPNPYIVIMDELGYYFAEGIAVMFAQARSLGFQMIAAGQDLAAMSKGENKEEVKAMTANTKVKWTLALEDPEETFELFDKSAGEAISTQVSGYTGSVGVVSSWATMFNAGIEKVRRLTLQELKRLRSGQGVMIFGDSVVRFSAFYVFGKAKIAKEVPVRINRFLQVMTPDFVEIMPFGKPLAKRVAAPGDVMSEREAGIEKVLYRFKSGEVPVYSGKPSRVWSAVVDANRKIVTEIGATERGIVLYEAAIRAMRLPEPSASEAAATGEVISAVLDPQSGLVDPAAGDSADELLDILGTVIGAPPVKEKVVQDVPPWLMPDVETAIRRGPEDAVSDREWIREVVPGGAASGAGADEESAPPTGALGVPGSEALNAVILGLTEKTAAQVEEIETLLGNPAPAETVAEVELTVAEGLDWKGEKSRPSSATDLDAFFNGIEMTF